MEGCTDGTLISTGQKFFNCPQGHGIYYPLVNLYPDARFMDHGHPGITTDDSCKCLQYGLIKIVCDLSGVIHVPWIIL